MFITFVSCQIHFENCNWLVIDYGCKYIDILNIDNALFSKSIYCGVF